MSSNGIAYEESYDTVPEHNPNEILASRDALFKEGSKFKPIKHSEIIGIDNVLVEIDQIIHWLRNSEKYTEHNSRLEPGIIFEGSPGTGKTLVSRYIATASEAMFINVREFAHAGSLFKDSDIADLFDRCRAKYAKDKKPIVLFWDEFETVAMDRSEAEASQATAVSQLTAELDGIHGKNEGLLLIGCTNYIYNVDEALKRAGRMGLQIEFHAPDREGKKMILKHYLSAYKTKGEIDIETLSYCFDSDATAADIEEACVEAWRQAVWRIIEDGGSKSLTQEDLLQVFLKRLVGPPTSFINLPPEDQHRIAVHECGHAIMAAVYDIPLRLITVHPGKKSLGRVMTIELREHIATVDELMAKARVSVGSIAAEAEAGLPAITGTRGDIESVNRLANHLTTKLNEGKRAGLWHPGVISAERAYGQWSANPAVSPSSTEDIDADTRDILDSVMNDAERTMASIGSKNLHEIASRVTDAVTLTGDDFKAALTDVLGTDDFSQFR